MWGDTSQIAKIVKITNKFNSCIIRIGANMDQHMLRQFAPQIKKIAEKHGIAKVFVFGSTARGEATEHSDIDFLVEMQDDVSLFGIAGFGYETEKLLGVHVDVVPLSALSQVSDQGFVKHIQEDAVAL
jgi:predicted nucleotidyltransferase